MNEDGLNNWRQAQKMIQKEAIMGLAAKYIEWAENMEMNPIDLFVKGPKGSNRISDQLEHIAAIRMLLRRRENETSNN
jgi:hypothetical protein